MYLSFIIPVYNGEAWIEQCVINLLKMKSFDYEIVLVDDGSSDHSFVIGKKLSSSYDQVHIYHQENRGVSTARNLGISKAEGKYIVFCDVDDYLDMDLFNQLIQVYQSACENDLLFFGVCFDYYFYNILYRKETPHYSSSGLIYEETWKNDLVNLYSCNALNSVWAKVFRKDIIEEHHLKFNTGMHIYEDLEFVLRYLKYCKTVYHSSDVVYHYRIVEEKNNPGRRLQKIGSLNQYLDSIRKPLEELVNYDPLIQDKTCIDTIMNKLYLVLVREKISASKINQIRSICQDAKLWFCDNKTGLSVSDIKRVCMLEDEKVFAIAIKDICTKIRHRLAVSYKIFKSTRERK